MSCKRVQQAYDHDERFHSRKNYEKCKSNKKKREKKSLLTESKVKFSVEAEKWRVCAYGM